MLRKILLFGLLVALLPGCRQKNENLHTGADSLAIGKDSVDAARKLVFLDCNAVVVGEGVRLRSEPDTKAEVVEKLGTGTLLKIIRTNDKKVLMGKPDKCNPDGFPWYEVMEGGGKRGWIYGEFLYQLVIKERNDEDLDGVMQKLWGRQYMFGGTWYRIGYARSGYRSYTDDQQDTLCVDYLLPFLYSENEGVVYPLKFEPNRKNRFRMVDLTREQGYFRFTYGGSYDDRPVAFRMLQDELQLTFFRELVVGDENPLTYTLLIRQGNGFFSATPADLGKEYLW